MVEEMIHKLASISAITADDQKYLSKVFNRNEITKGEMYLQCNDISNKIGFLCRGAMKFYYILESGVERIKYIALPGDFVFNVVTFMKRTESMFYIEALTDSVLYEATYQEIDGSIRKDNKYEKIMNRLLIES